jgi:hypothetical protein
MARDVTFLNVGQRHLLPALVYAIKAAAPEPVKAGPFGIPCSRSPGAGK